MCVVCCTPSQACDSAGGQAVMHPHSELAGPPFVQQWHTSPSKILLRSMYPIFFIIQSPALRPLQELARPAWPPVSASWRLYCFSAGGGVPAGAVQDGQEVQAGSCAAGGRALGLQRGGPTVAGAEKKKKNQKLTLCCMRSGRDNQKCPHFLSAQKVLNGQAGMCAAGMGGTGSCRG